MNIVEIINNKIFELQESKNRKDLINNELKEINKYLEILNKLDKEMLKFNLTKLKEILEKYNYYISNIDTLFSDVNNLIEFYVIKKNQILKLPAVYEVKLNEIKNSLKQIKDKLENNLTEKFLNDEDLEILKKINLLIEGQEIDLTSSMLKVLYENIIVDLSDDEKLELYKLLFESKNKKKFKNTELNAETIKNKDEDDVITKLIKMFKGPRISVIKKYIEDNKEELHSVINIESAKEILKFIEEKRLMSNFDIPSLVTILCYGKLENIQKVYAEIEKIKNSVDPRNEGIVNLDSFCNMNVVAMWLNPPIIKWNPGKKGRKSAKEEKIVLPKSIKNKDMNIANIEINVEMILSNIDLFDLNKLSKEKIYNNSIVRTMPPYILKKNIGLARTFGIYNLNLSAVKNDMENRIHKAIEIGLLKAPKLNSYKYVNHVSKNLATKNEKLKSQFKGLSYFEYNTSNLSNFSENEFAYYTSILSKNGLDSLYFTFYNSDHSINDHGDLSNYDKKNDYKKEFITDNSFSEYNEVIDEFNSEFANFNGLYFDPEIVYDPVIIEFERDFGIKDVNTEAEMENAIYHDDYVYKFKNKLLSRYRVLRNASILKEKYHELNRELLLASIIKDSYITEKEYLDIKNSQFFKELSFLESRSK